MPDPTPQEVVEAREGLDHTAAINLLRLEIGRLRCNAVHPNWAHKRDAILKRCEQADATVQFLLKLKGPDHG